MKLRRQLAITTILLLLVKTAAWAAPYRLADVTVVAADKQDPMVYLAADELRGYIRQLTGIWPVLATSPTAGRPAIVLRTGSGELVPGDGPDPIQNFALYIEGGQQVVHGASARATLWAAYTLIESWGVGFYLGGDAVPRRNPPQMVELVEGRYRPVLAIRGNLPWFNFLNSPTTWNPQDYKTFFAQMAKQKANLVSFHVYDHEPFCGYDITDYKVTMGGPLMTTISEHRWWSPHAMSTKDHLFGTGLFFDRGEWGCEVGVEQGWTFAPGRATRWQQRMMADALTYARSLGLATCLGFEVSGDPLDEEVGEQLRRRITHVLETYPLDYLGIWQAEHLGLAGATGTREGDTASDAKELWDAFAYLPDSKHQAEGVRMARHVRLSYEAMRAVRPEVRMVVSGWGGDQHMRFTDYYSGLDKVVPADIIFAALDNIDPRHADHVSEVYGQLQPGRACWPIPWFESDAGHTRIDQTGPQTNVTAFEPLLKDIARKGCEGALGIHWRTRNVEDVAGYLYRFGWNDGLSATEFLRQYVRDQYAPEDVDRMTSVHLRLEELGPQYVGAVGTVECGSKFFGWFCGGRSPLLSRKPNMAGILPDPERFGELDALAGDLLDRSLKAAEDGRRHAAVAYHDLARTIEWLVKRARVGLAIWGDAAPLEEALRQAEKLYTDGQQAEAREAARSVLRDLERYDFASAMRALATTCRTRGELGMLATANARYGRYYACFIERIGRILGEPLPEARGNVAWEGGEVLTVFPVPNRVSSGEAVNFDAVLLPTSAEAGFHIELVDLDQPQAEAQRLPLRRLGGAYHRGVFFPPGPGAWSWRLVASPEYTRPANAIPLPEGVLTAGR
ncbi:MAG: hypothetical protein GXY55_03135 [Phycisphaerae bacterium]|nr:hypothetical protein [Phycisphaerae bacterium]